MVSESLHLTSILVGLVLYHTYRPMKLVLTCFLGKSDVVPCHDCRLSCAKVANIHFLTPGYPKHLSKTKSSIQPLRSYNLESFLEIDEYIESVSSYVAKRLTKIWHVSNVGEKSRTSRKDREYTNTLARPTSSNIFEEIPQIYASLPNSS